MTQINVDQFIDGQRDCEKGIPHEQGKGESYDRGYRAQYELEQIKSEATRYAAGRS